MRFRPVLPASALLLLFAACEAPPPDIDLTAEDREAIEALADRYAERALAGDFERWADLYHPDAIRLYPGTEDWEGREGILAAVRAMNAIPDVLEIATVEVEGNRELAYSRGTYRFELTMQEDGEEVAMQDEGSWLLIVRTDEDDEWRIYRHVHNSNLAPTAVPEAED